MPCTSKNVSGTLYIQCNYHFVSRVVEMLGLAPVQWDVKRVASNWSSSHSIPLPLHT